MRVASDALNGANTGTALKGKNILTPAHELQHLVDPLSEDSRLLTMLTPFGRFCSSSLPYGISAFRTLQEENNADTKRPQKVTPPHGYYHRRSTEEEH